MWNIISLRTRIYLILVGLVLITLMGGIVMTSYTYRMETLLNSIISKYLSAFQTAEALEIALVNQKGFVSYYFIDADPDWLRQLGEYRQIFKERYTFFQCMQFNFFFMVFGNIMRYARFMRQQMLDGNLITFGVIGDIFGERILDL